LVTPFAPSRSAHHGCPRVVCGLATALAERHRLVVLHLEAERAIDRDLADRCDVRTLSTPARGRWGARTAGAGGLLRGRSLWASEFGMRRLQNTVASLVAEFDPDVVQVEHAVVGEALAGAGKRAIRVVTMHETAASLREFIPLRREGLALAHRLDLIAAARQERRVLSLAHAAVVFSDRDRDGLAAHSRPVATIPVGWDVPPQRLDPLGATPPVVLFCGSFEHPPNVEAAIRLAREIFPRVRGARPDARLELVGPSPPAELRALAGESVSVTGAVASVVPHLDRATVVVAPIEIGGGVRVKVLEALAGGKAVVASSRAAEGISAQPGSELIVADGNESIAAAIVRLLIDDRSRRQLAERANSWALRELSWSAMADRYDELYDRIARGLRVNEASSRMDERS
jgi:glycosyltransferase involved in cell wall biosynthesis